MAMSARKRGNLGTLLAPVVLSSSIMLWLFWHFPVGTGIATVAVLAGFGLLMRMA